MAVDTGVFPAELEDRLRYPLQHLYRVTVFPASGPSFTVAVDGRLEVTRSLGWSPYAQAQLTIKTPWNPDELAALDGRARTWVRIEMGYAYDGKAELHPVARLRLEDADENFAAGTVSLSLQGRELEAQDADWNGDWSGLLPRSGVREAIRYVLAQTGTGSSVPWAGIGDRHRADLVTAEAFDPADGADLWSLASGLADSAGLKLWFDGEDSGSWHLRPRHALSGTYATMLRTGRDGTITAGTRKRGRTGWANEVRLLYPDVLQANGRPVFGSAHIKTGPYSTAAAGRKVHFESRPGRISSNAAFAQAEALLRTLSASGNTYTLDAAAAYWLRPGMTVPVKTGRGPYERQLVQSVTFKPLEGLMSLETIKNEETA